jgi:hypothetical protein
MPKAAKLYVYLVSVLGTLALISAFWRPPEPHDLLRVGAYFLLSLVAAALKLRLPGLTGTMSIGFVLVLLSMVELTLPETMLLACAGVIVQCLWRAQRRPRAVQVIFSLAAVAASVVLAYQCTNLLKSRWHVYSIPVLMAPATCLYFAANSLPVAGVLALAEGVPLRTVWARAYLLSFPYYLLGGTVAGLIAAASREIGWQLPLLTLPVMGLAFVFFRILIARLASEPAATVVNLPQSTLA